MRRYFCGERIYQYTPGEAVFHTNPKCKRGVRRKPRLRFGLVWNAISAPMCYVADSHPANAARQGPGHPGGIRFGKLQRIPHRKPAASKRHALLQAFLRDPLELAAALRGLRHLEGDADVLGDVIEHLLVSTLGPEASAPGNRRRRAACPGRPSLEPLSPEILGIPASRRRGTSYPRDRAPTPCSRRCARDSSARTSKSKPRPFQVRIR